MEYLLLFAVVLGCSDWTFAARRMVDMSHTYNTNMTLVYPGVNYYPMQLSPLANSNRWWTLGNNRVWYESNEFSMPEHAGTHIDAPAHFARGPGLNWFVHEIPIERLVGEAVVIDISYKADPVTNPDATLDVTDIVKWEEKYGKIKDGSIVLVHSGWDKYWGDASKYLGSVEKDMTKLHFPSFSAEAAQWLLDNRNIYGVGADVMSIDVGTATDFPVHIILLSKNIWGLENVKNIGKLPPVGARLFVAPMKINKGSGAPTRIIAEFDDTPGATTRPNGATVSSASLLITTVALIVTSLLQSI